MRPAERWLPWLLPFVAVLPNPAAALPWLSYYFRDFSLTFYPLRLLMARELREGRWPFWNPYVGEGTFLTPFYYPLDLLLAVRPTPESTSWLLTLHLPMAALGMYALARELGQRRPGAFCAGAAFALGGLAASSLNLYVYLQALALAPFVALALRRAALAGGRAVVAAALLVALSVSTLAIEFVGQAVLFGVALGLETAPWPAAARRMAAAVTLGVGLAAVPVAVMLGLLPETSRGAGFASEIALANAVHPAALLQALVPGVFGSLHAPADAFWGGRFFSKGFPYFVSLYVGPFVLALGAAGLGPLPRRRRLLLLALGAAGLWFSLGERGGLAAWVSELPGLRAVRFPSKALLLPHLALTLLAGSGIDALAAGSCWRRFLSASVALAALPAALGLVALGRPDLVGAAFGLELADPRPLAGVVAGEMGRAALLAGIAVIAAVAVRAGRLRPPLAAAALCVAVVLDLSRAGAGLNPQVRGSFFDPAPELAAARLDDPAGGRLFSFETERSPAARAFLERARSGRVAGAFLLHRRLMAPYTNIVDRVETALGKDLGGVVLHGPELAPEEYDPALLSRILPRLRDAGVSHLLSLDALDHPALALVTTAPAGPPGTTLHLYRMEGALPVAYVACQVRVPPPARAATATLEPGFDARREVVLGRPVETSCRSGSARLVRRRPGLDLYDVEADGAGVLVTRDSFASGWGAAVDGRPTSVLLANGKHRGVPVAAGRHRVEFRYEPPGLRAGLAASGLALAACALLWWRRPAAAGAAAAAGPARAFG